MVKTTSVRGPTLARLSNVSVWQLCGKPSTKFPHGGLVECLPIPRTSYFPRLKNLFFLFFLEFRIFHNFQKNRDIISLVVTLRFSCLNTFILIFDIRSTRFSLGFLEVHRAKPCQLDQFQQIMYHFAGPSLVGSAIVSV